MTYDEDYDDYADDDSYNVDCPHCGESIYDDVDQCPHCRNFILASDFKKPLPRWILVGLVLLVISFLLPTVWQLLKMLTMNP